MHTVNKPKTTRVQLELPEKSMERLRRLKDLTEASSYAEVAKNALVLYERIMDMHESGDKFLVRDESGKQRQLEFFMRKS